MIQASWNFENQMFSFGFRTFTHTTLPPNWETQFGFSIFGCLDFGHLLYLTIGSSYKMFAFTSKFHQN